MIGGDGGDRSGSKTGGGMEKMRPESRATSDGKRPKNYPTRPMKF